MLNEAIVLVPPDPIRILSVEDHPVFREGLSTIIASQSDMELVAQASNAAEAMAEFRHHRPDITLMDLRLPGANGTDALIAIRVVLPDGASPAGGRGPKRRPAPTRCGPTTSCSTGAQTASS